MNGFHPFWKEKSRPFVIPAGDDFMKLRIGSRQSKLALAQAAWVGEELLKKNPTLDISYVSIVTTGDKESAGPIQEMGGKGIFVKEIEEALLKNEIDVAVHSLKDVPQMLPPGLILAGFPMREDNRDAVISKFGELLNELPRNAVIGTGSPRRSAQIKNRYKNKYRVEPIRGNVDTRLKKLQNGHYDTLIMAVAGLKRLGLEKEITHILEWDDMLPAPGQGCLGLELRQEDATVLELLATIKHKESDITARAERAFLQGIGGDCLVPLGAYAQLKEDNLVMEAVVLDKEGTKKVTVKESGSIAEPELVGGMLAERLLHEGGAELL